ncbi:hypothetical protein ACFXPW_06780 [Streptomyces goshikiensis]|uniref:hypothetical protein n=1 Tax=Streptomyces goshikiensis TaxID=1942 RepID=UPI0036A88BFB
MGAHQERGPGPGREEDAHHPARIGSKTAANQCDPTAWVYDVGENSDCSVDALISDNVADIIRAFARWPSAKASFATKFVNPDLLLLDPRGRTRVRFSVMPQEDSKLLDIRTSPVESRIAAAGDFLRYRGGVKSRAVETMRTLVAGNAPWLRIRYAF